MVPSHSYCWMICLACANEIGRTSAVAMSSSLFQWNKLPPRRPSARAPHAGAPWRAPSADSARDRSGAVDNFVGDRRRSKSGASYAPDTEQCRRPSKRQQVEPAARATGGLVGSNRSSSNAARCCACRVPGNCQGNARSASGATLRRPAGRQFALDKRPFQPPS